MDWRSFGFQVNKFFFKLGLLSKTAMNMQCKLKIKLM